MEDIQDRTLTTVDDGVSVIPKRPDMAKNNELMEQPESQVTLADFCSIDKVEAFADYYAPATWEGDGVEVFNDARLREFFKAVPCGMGDPLSIYLAELKKRGFRMRVSMTGEPSIFATIQPQSEAYMQV